MSVVTKLSVMNFRSHDKFTLLLSPQTTVITGKNGSGKTSLIEALYIGLQGCSFRSASGDILKKGSTWWKIDIEFDDYSKRTVTFSSGLVSGRKKIIIDNKSMSRMIAKYKFPVVLFEPDDLRLLNGSPERRRQFIDRFISQLDPLYSSNLYKYSRALKQRNNLLKKPSTTDDELFTWNIALSEYGSYIVDKRIAFIEKINNRLNETYNEIAKTNDTVTIHYSNTYIGDIRQKILNDLYSHTVRDKILGFTSTGVHRHDVIFEFNNSPALDVASRGEVRSIVLAMKFLEVDIIEQIIDQKPIILLDDVFSELDIHRQKALSETIKSHQIIITSTNILAESDKFKHVCL